MRYPFTAVRGVSSTFADHLKEPGRAGVPGTDYLTIWKTDKGVALCDGAFREWLDGNGTKYCSFFSGVPMSIAGINLPVGTRWDFLHCDTVYAPNSAELKPVKEGEAMFLCGNTGYVLPKPTPERPWAGSHTHVSIRPHWQQKDWIDPQPIMDALAQIKPQSAPVETTPTPVVDQKVEEIVKQRDEALEREKQATKDLEAAKAEVATKTADFEAKIADLSQQVYDLTTIDTPTGYVSEDALASIAEETVDVDGLLGRWGKFVDDHVKSQTLKSILKYDIFVVVGSTVGTVAAVGVAPVAKQYLGIDVSPDLAVGIGVVLGVVGKLLLTRYDRNKDGKLDEQDFTVLS